MLGRCRSGRFRACWHVSCVRPRQHEQMIRIVTEKGKSGWIVRIQGHLRGDDIPALEETCRNVHGNSQLNLEELRSLDEAGIAAIRGLVAGGAIVVGASTYIRMRLAPQNGGGQ